MSFLTRETQPRSGNAHGPAQSLTFDRLRDLSLTIRTTLDVNTFFTTVLPLPIRHLVFVAHDETYPYQPDIDEQRHFIICSDQPTYNHTLLDLRSKGLLVTPGIQRAYWTRVASKLENGEVCRATPSSSYVPLVQPGPEIIPARPPRRVIYGGVQVDVVAIIMAMFPQRASMASASINNALSHVGPGAPSLNHDYQLGPTGQPSCLPIILAHTTPWTPRAAHRAGKLASREVKGLAREFCIKYQDLVDRCRHDFRINLTPEGATVIANGIRNRYERKKWIVTQIREIKRFNKDVDVMLCEYRTIMSHCRRLQKACIEAANEAYNIDIIIVPTHIFPAQLPLDAPLPQFTY